MSIPNTGPPLAAGGPRPPGKSRGTGRKFASYRGVRVRASYSVRGREASSEQKEVTCLP
jgi:hypothetical protein